MIANDCFKDIADKFRLTSPTPKHTPVQMWIYEHPTVVKVLEISCLIVGIGLLISLAFVGKIYGTAFVVSVSITGSLLALVSLTALTSLDIIVPPHHNMKHHTYKPGKCEGGELYYDGDVPTLSLNADNPRSAGKAQGYLCGEAICRLTRRLDLVFYRFYLKKNHTMLEKARKTLQQEKYKAYLEEMEGLVEGYNKWARKHWWKLPKKISVDDIFFLNLIPDSLHCDQETIQQEAPVCHQEKAVACAAIVTGDSQTGPTFARNLDWHSLGILGKESLVINRKHKQGSGLHNTIEVGFPGFIGTLTGMNSKGLSIAMNCCYFDQVIEGGLMSSLYNRYCLEHFQYAPEVKTFSKEQAPLTPYHLTIADDLNVAESIHFNQKLMSGGHCVRQSKDDILITLNYYCYNSKSGMSSTNFDTERQVTIENFLRERGTRPLEDALALPFVNNERTIHSVVMQPKTRRFEVAFDNAFSGKAQRQPIDTKRCFQAITDNDE